MNHISVETFCCFLAPDVTPIIYILPLNNACICLQSATCAIFEDVALFQDSGHGRFSGHLGWCAYSECHLSCYIVVLFTLHGLILSTALFIWGADWQSPSLKWSVCFSDLAKAIWCILTIIGATATMMFSKPLCYFPRECPQGIFEDLLGLQRGLHSQDRWEDLQIRDTMT